MKFELIDLDRPHYILLRTPGGITDTGCTDIANAPYYDGSEGFWRQSWGYNAYTPGMLLEAAADGEDWPLELGVVRPVLLH